MGKDVPGRANLAFVNIASGSCSVKPVGTSCIFACFSATTKLSRAACSAPTEHFPVPYTSPSRECPRLPFTARIERAHSDRARSASKKGTLATPTSFLTRKMSGDYSQIPVEIAKFMRITYLVLQKPNKAVSICSCEQAGQARKARRGVKR